VSDRRNNSNLVQMCKTVLLLITITLNVAMTTEPKPKLVFESKTSMRESLCLYDDGKFYYSKPAGCIMQAFKWGTYVLNNDTAVLKFSPENIFNYDLIQSSDTTSEFQIVRILDCYNQPVRFQHISSDTGYSNLFNIGLIRLKKGNSINYYGEPFEHISNEIIYVTSNSDTLTYKWRCNRECLESVSGGRLFADTNAGVQKILLRNKEFEFVR
jgi:hypothetical protein